MLQSWNPWQELEEAQRRLGRAVRSDESASWAPATDIVEDSEGLYLYLDLPDVDEGSLEVESEQNNLSVKATRRYRLGENQTVHYQGRPKGTFSRVFNVPASFDLSKVTASYDNGVLTLLVPRSESTRPRKIDVSTGRTHQGNAEVQETQEREVERA
jgi:HSP20 family protein